MSKESWHKGYKEVKNVLHNEMGITNDEILEVFRQVAKDEIAKIVSEKSTFIFSTLSSVIENEMIKAVKDHKYPKVTGNRWDYGYQGQGDVNFQDFVSGVMKEEISNWMKEQYTVSINIDKKG